MIYIARYISAIYIADRYDIFGLKNIDVFDFFDIFNIFSFYRFFYVMDIKQFLAIKEMLESLNTFDFGKVCLWGEGQVNGMAELDIGRR